MQLPQVHCCDEKHRFSKTIALLMMLGIQYSLEHKMLICDNYFYFAMKQCQGRVFEHVCVFEVLLRGA